MHKAQSHVTRVVDHVHTRIQVTIEPHTVAALLNILGSGYSKVFDRVSKVEVTSLPKYVRAVGAVPAKQRKRMLSQFEKQVGPDLRPLEPFGE